MGANEPRDLYARATGADASGLLLHVRVQGQSRDIALEILQVDSASSDQVIKAAVARYLDINVDSLRQSIVERHETGHITLRPAAVFG